MCSLARTVTELSVSNILVQSIKGTDWLHNATVTGEANLMKIKQELFEGSLLCQGVLPFFLMLFYFLTPLFLLQKLKKGPSKNGHLAILFQSIKTVLFTCGSVVVVFFLFGSFCSFLCRIITRKILSSTQGCH